MYQSLNKIPEAILRKHLLAIYNNLILEQQKGLRLTIHWQNRPLNGFFQELIVN